jgi:hypothetical protein
MDQIYRRKEAMQLKQVNRDYHQDLPTAAELKSIRPGRTVRLALSSGSRFWAQVTHQRRDGMYTAISLDNLGPVCSGEPVCFKESHVFAVL